MPRNMGEKGFFHHFIIPSNYWMLSVPGPNNLQWSTSLNAMRLVPIVLGRSGTLNGVALHVVSGNANSVTRLGLYSATGTGLPGSLLGDFGTITSSSNGLRTITGLSVSVEPKMYFLAAVAQTATCVLRAGTTNNILIGQSASTYSDQVNAAYEYTGVSGALSAGPLGTPNSTGNAGPAIYFRMT